MRSHTVAITGFCAGDLIEAGLSEAAFTQRYGDFVLAARIGLMSGTTGISLKRNVGLPQQGCRRSIAGVLSSADGRGGV